MPSGQSVVKVLDFGVAAAAESSGVSSKVTPADSLIGSPAYMSPEQMLASSEVDARTDVWSLGAALYGIITGQLPFPGQTHLQIFATAMTRPPLPLAAHLEGVPAQVEQVVFRCLEKEPGARYASMHELSSALRASIA